MAVYVNAKKFFIGVALPVSLCRTQAKLSQCLNVTFAVFYAGVIARSYFASKLLVSLDDHAPTLLADASGELFLVPIVCCYSSDLWHYFIEHLQCQLRERCCFEALFHACSRYVP